MENERERENKTNDSFPPSLDDVKQYIAEKHYTFQAIDFFSHYDKSSWHSNNRPIRNWRALADSWQSNETSKTATTQQSTEIDKYMSVVNVYTGDDE